MLGITHDLDDYLEKLGCEAARVDRQAVARLADRIYQAWQDGRFVFVFGNGGSGATASHFAEDLAKNAVLPEHLHDGDQRRPRVLSLADHTSWITAIANDLEFDQIFRQQLMQFGQAGDVVIAISGSGNSRNILAAVAWARQHGLYVVGLTGFDGGRLHELQDDGVCLHLDDMGLIESIHLALLHWVVGEIHARVNQVGRHYREGANAVT